MTSSIQASNAFVSDPLLLRSLLAYRTQAMNPPRMVPRAEVAALADQGRAIAPPSQVGGPRDEPLMRGLTGREEMDAVQVRDIVTGMYTSLSLRDESG